MCIRDSSISIWMSTAIAEVYMAGKSCHILRPVPIEHEYDPVIYAGAKYVTNYEDFVAAMAEEETELWGEGLKIGLAQMHYTNAFRIAETESVISAVSYTHLGV